MKKRTGMFWVILLVFVIVISFFLTGCEEASPEVKYETLTPAEYYESKGTEARFVVIGKDELYMSLDDDFFGYTYEVIYFADKETNVVYFMTEYGDVLGMSPLLDVNGEPLIWDGNNIR